MLNCNASVVTVVALATLLFFTTTGADGAIINVAAVAGAGGNTVRTSDGNDGTGTWLGDGSGSTWVAISDGSFTGNILSSELLNQGGSVTTGTAPALTMTVSTPDPIGIYNVYVIYQTDDTSMGGSAPITTAPYNIQAGLSAGSLSVFDDTSGGYTGGNRVIVPGGRYLNERRVLVGTASGASVSLFIADYTGLSGVDNETRWEGMAYEQIGQLLPEPASVTMLMLGLPFVRRGRRR